MTDNPQNTLPMSADAQQAYDRMRQAAQLHRERNIQVKRERLIEPSGLGKRFADATFDEYLTENQQQAHALEACRRFAGNFTKVLELGSNLVMLGNTGTGKTMLAACILTTIIRAGHTGKYHTVQTLIREFRSSWGKDSKTSEREMLAGLANLDLLIVDEVGVQYGTDAEKVALFEVINARYEAMKPTILISNLMTRQDGTPGPCIEDSMGDRIIDRLRHNGLFLGFNWQSKRCQSGKQANNKGIVDK